MFTTRPSVDQDYQFLFELKKASEYQVIDSIFGWDEQTQKEIHRQEWQQARPIIVEIDGVRVGSFLVQTHIEYWYFGRFFLLPTVQGKGIGTKILSDVIANAAQAQMPLRLCYLQGNRVGELYRRLVFKQVSQDQHFVYMIKD